VYGSAPFSTTKSISPSFTPKQVISFGKISALMPSVGAVIVAEEVCVQPFASVIMTLYVPPAKSAKSSVSSLSPVPSLSQSNIYRCIGRGNAFDWGGDECGGCLYTTICIGDSDRICACG